MQTVNAGGFAVVGLSETVRNDDPEAIAVLWQAFRTQDLRSRLNAESEAVYCVYHEYDGGFMDPYRMTIGYRVAEGDAVPDGLHRATIPEQSMAVYDATGPQPQTLIAQWQDIWNGDLPRAYAADYDVYTGPEAVHVHVGLK